METDTKKRYQSWARPSWAQSDQMIDGWVIRLLFNNTSQHIDQSNRSKLPKLLEPFIHFGSNWTNRSFVNLSSLKNKRFDFNKSSTSIQQGAAPPQENRRALCSHDANIQWPRRVSAKQKPQPKKNPSENTFNLIENLYKFFTHWLFAQIIDLFPKRQSWSFYTIYSNSTRSAWIPNKWLQSNEN